MSATAIHIKDIDKHRTLFLVTGIEEADADLIADVEYTDIYPGGYVFYIQVYCPRYQTKICYNRFHSRAFLLKDKSALEEEFCDLDTMEEAAFDGVKRCKMTRDDVAFLKGNMPAEKIIRQRGDACV